MRKGTDFKLHLIDSKGNLERIGFFLHQLTTKNRKDSQTEDASRKNEFNIGLLFPLCSYIYLIICLRYICLCVCVGV